MVKEDAVADIESHAIILNEQLVNDTYQYLTITPVPWDDYGIVQDQTFVRVKDGNAVFDEPYLLPLLGGLIDWWDGQRNADKTMFSEIEFFSSSECRFTVADRSTGEIVIFKYSGTLDAGVFSAVTI